MTTPPLNALKVFEVAARSGSFTLAGAELGVTSAAVSLQIRALESHLGRQLFLRQGNRLSLTDAGQALYPRVAAALTDLAAATDALSDDPGRGRITLSCLPSLAELWLVPRLAGLALAPRINLRIEEEQTDLATDIRLTYGAQDGRGQPHRRLFAARIVAVAAPGRFDSVKNLPCTAFVHTDWGRRFASHPDWGTWAAAAGVKPPDPSQGVRVSHTSAAVAAAKAGLGVALAPLQLVQNDISAGTLTLLPGPDLPMSWDYVVLTTAASARRPAVQALVQALCDLGAA
jgi:LysR family transcriptional regulator, glycine cleavage system transcriptional activator